MRFETYHCPQCKQRLVRVARWLGYACEHCRIAVTMVNAETVRILLATDADPQIVPISELRASA